MMQCVTRMCIKYMDMAPTQGVVPPQHYLDVSRYLYLLIDLDAQSHKFSKIEEGSGKDDISYRKICKLAITAE